MFKKATQLAFHHVGNYPPPWLKNWANLPVEWVGASEVEGWCLRFCLWFVYLGVFGSVIGWVTFRVS